MIENGGLERQGTNNVGGMQFHREFKDRKARGDTVTGLGTD